MTRLEVLGEKQQRRGSAGPKEAPEPRGRELVGKRLVDSSPPSVFYGKGPGKSEKPKRAGKGK